MQFFRVTLEKIVIAKLIGVPLLAIDYFYKNFLTSSVWVNIVILIFTSYIISCTIVYLYNRYKLMRTSNSRTSTSKF
ncbi:MAG: hypothetical protein QXO27_01735 [Candidatus Aenigmatarchaeota archaeon]